jgi:hypothetical protein
VAYDRSAVGPGATWLLAVDTLAGPRDVDLRLPPDAVLRWPPDAQVIGLDAADYARLAALADQLERSYEASNASTRILGAAFPTWRVGCSDTRARMGCRGAWGRKRLGGPARRAAGVG